MALQALYSFDHIATANLIELPNAISVDVNCAVLPATGRDNSGCMSTADILNFGSKSFNFAVTPSSVCSLGAWVVIEAAPGADGILFVLGNPAVEFPTALDKVISVVVASDGSIKVWGGNVSANTVGALIATSASGILTFGLNESHYIEIAIVIDPVGSLMVRVDGIPVIDRPTINTRIVGVNDITHIMLGNPAGNQFRTRYDDVYACSGADTGDGWVGIKGVLQVDGKLVNAAGEVTQWVPSVPNGVNFANINENTAPDQTTFNTVSTVGAKDLYNVEDVIYTPIALQVDLYVRKTTAGASSISHVLRPTLSGADFTAPMQSITTAFKYHKQIYTTNPAGGAWTMAAYNALQVGIVKAE